MLKHQLFDFRVVTTTPVRARQERPANFDFARGFIVAVVATRADDRFAFFIDECKCGSAIQRAVEIAAKDRLQVTILLRMQSPDFRIRCRREHAVPIGCFNRPHDDTFSSQGWLQISITAHFLEISGSILQLACPSKIILPITP